MAYGIGSILGDIDQKADAYRNNPDALAQSYQQNQQLIDLLVLQKLKTDKEAAQRDMQAKMQTPAATIKDQRAQEVMGMTRNEVAQQVTPGLQTLGQQMQAAQAQPQAQGIASVPAPNMQQVGMKGGGIVAFAEAGPVEGAESGGEGFDWSTLGGIAGATAMYGPALVSAIQKGGAEAKAAFAAIKNMPLSNMARRAAAPVMLGSTAYNTATTPTEDYTERFGFDPVRGTGIGSFLKELGIRSLGAASDLGNAVGFGLPGKLYKDKQPEPKATPPADTTATPPAKGKTKAEDDAYLAMLEGGGGTENQNQNQNQNQNAKFTSKITDVDNERYVASMLGEDLGARKVPEPTSNGISTVAPNAAPENEDAIYQASLAPNGISSITNAYKERNAANERNIASMLGEDLSVLNVPANDVAQAPPPVREAYAKQLADLRGKEESRLEYLIAFLKGAGGQSSFAATMMGGSDAMNAREAQVKGEIMDVLGKLETIDLKEREFGLKERELGQTDTQLENQRANSEAVNAAAIRRNEIDADTQRATQALQEAQAANLGSPTLTDQETQAETYVKNALEQGSTKSVVALRQEYYRQLVADEQEVALARLGITDRGQAEDLYIKIMAQTDKAFGELPPMATLKMTPEDVAAWRTNYITTAYAELKTYAPPVANLEGWGEPTVK